MVNDVVIIGGGPVGLSLAKALVSLNLKVMVIDKLPQEKIESPQYDGREIALTIASQQIMSQLGQWQLIRDENIHLIQSARVLDGNSPYFLKFIPQNVHNDRLGYIISNHHIRKAAFAAVQENNSIDFLFGREVTDINFNNDSATVSINDGSTLSARLVVAADSRFSKLRQLSGISCNMLDFGRTCIVCKVMVTKPHDQIATEWFQHNQTLALLPLGPNELSVVITIETDQRHKILSLSPDDFSVYLAQQVGDHFGNVRLVSELYSYPLVATYANQFYAKRLALVGDSAVGMHPVTAQGFNLGLLSVNALAVEVSKAIASNQDIGSTRILEVYHRHHRRTSYPIYTGTNHLVRLYTDTHFYAKIARKALLRLGNHIGPARRLIVTRLTQSITATRLT